MFRPIAAYRWWDLYITTRLSILYKTFLARKLSKPEDGRYRPKHVVFPLLINTIVYPQLSCVFDWIYLTTYLQIFVLFYVWFCFVSFCVLLMCNCVLYCCRRVSTQLQLTNTSFRVPIFFHVTSLFLGMGQSVILKHLMNCNKIFLIFYHCSSVMCLRGCIVMRTMPDSGESWSRGQVQRNGPIQSHTMYPSARTTSGSRLVTDVGADVGTSS